MGVPAGKAPPGTAARPGRVAPRAFPRQAAVEGGRRGEGRRPRGASGTRGPQSPRRPPHPRQLRTLPRAGPTWPGLAAAASGCAQVTPRPRVPRPGPGGKLLPAARAGPAAGAPRRPSPCSHAAAGAREPSRIASRRETKVSPLLRGECRVQHRRAGEARGVAARPPGPKASRRARGTAAWGPVSSCVSSEASGGPRSWKPWLGELAAARSPRVVPSDADVALTARPTRRSWRSGADRAAKLRAARRSSPPSFAEFLSRGREPSRRLAEGLRSREGEARWLRSSPEPGCVLAPRRVVLATEGTGVTFPPSRGPGPNQRARPLARCLLVAHGPPGPEPRAPRTAEDRSRPGEAEGRGQEHRGPSQLLQGSRNQSALTSSLLLAFSQFDLHTTTHALTHTHKCEAPFPLKTLGWHPTA